MTRQRNSAAPEYALGSGLKKERKYATAGPEAKCPERILCRDLAMV
tara:strand:+ start:1161 stop:1298 length:138 start_codon:yes stop_codon:yes gene_type:complete